MECSKIPVPDQGRVYMTLVTTVIITEVNTQDLSTSLKVIL